MQEHFSALLDRSITRFDRVDIQRWQAYYRLFALGPAAPPLALHWLLFNELPIETRPDGHPIRMEPFPELPFPRRMWAGGEIEWGPFVTAGTELTRSSTISRAQMKDGTSGEFLLTSVTHIIGSSDGQKIRERQDIAFLAASHAGAAAVRKLAFEPEWSREAAMGSIDLFRYSALTLNSHRIHYDAPYTSDVEGFPALVVHGPLLISQLVHAGAQRREHERPRRLTYRSVAPVFAEEPYCLVGRRTQDGEQLAIIGRDQRLRATALLDFDAHRSISWTEPQ